MIKSLNFAPYTLCTVGLRPCCSQSWSQGFLSRYWSWHPALLSVLVSIYRSRQQHWLACRLTTITMIDESLTLCLFFLNIPSHSRNVLIYSQIVHDRPIQLVTFFITVRLLICLEHLTLPIRQDTFPGLAIYHYYIYISIMVGIDYSTYF